MNRRAFLKRSLLGAGLALLPFPHGVGQLAMQAPMGTGTSGRVAEIGIWTPSTDGTGYSDEGASISLAFAELGEMVAGIVAGLQPDEAFMHSAPRTRLCWKRGAWHVLGETHGVTLLAMGEED